MFDALRALLTRPGGAAPAAAALSDADRLQLAACALLLELAHADDEFSAGERTHIEEAIGRHFALPAVEVQTILERADGERRRAGDLFQFTDVIKQSYDEGQRMALAEVFWRVVLADGVLSDHEGQLMRKLSQLLDLRPGYLAEARKRAAGS